MDFDDSREEWRSSYDSLSSRIVIKKMLSVFKIVQLLKPKKKTDHFFKIWKTHLMNQLLLHYKSYTCSLLQDSSTQLRPIPAKSSIICFSEILNSIKTLINLIHSSSEALNKSKENWLVSKKILSQYSKISESDLINNISNRVNFWKSSLFPDLKLEDFWKNIEKLDPSLKLNILETELLLEQSRADSAENDWKNKIFVLQKQEKHHKTRMSEMAAYQSYLDKECSEIQKCWDDIRKIAESLEPNTQVVKISQFLNSRTQSFDRFFEARSAEDSFHEQGFSENEDFLESEKMIHVDFSGTRYRIDIGLRLRKNALRTFVHAFKVKKTLDLFRFWSFWKNRTCGKHFSPVGTLTDQFTVVPRMKSKTTAKPVLMNSRRLVEFEQSSAFYLQQKTFRKLFAQICKKLFFCLKKFQKNCLKLAFFKWMKTQKKEERKFLNFDSIKVIFLMSVVLGRNIFDGKKSTFFNVWRLAHQVKKNEELQREIEKIEDKVKSQVLREKEKGLEFKLAYQLLSAKVRVIESKKELFDMLAAKTENKSD